MRVRRSLCLCPLGEVGFIDAMFVGGMLVRLGGVCLRWEREVFS